MSPREGAALGKKLMRSCPVGGGGNDDGLVRGAVGEERSERRCAHE